MDTWTTSSALSYDDEGRRRVDSTVTYGAFAQEEDGAFHPERHTVYQAYRPEEGQTIDVSSGSGPQTPPPAPSSEPQTPPPAPSRSPEPARERGQEQPPARQDQAEQHPAEESGTEERPRGSESHGEGEDR